MKTFKPLILLLCLVLLVSVYTTTAYAYEETRVYKLDKFISQDTIEDDKYFENENSSLTFINDMLHLMYFDKFEYDSMDQLVESILEDDTWTRVNAYNTTTKNNNFIISALHNTPIQHSIGLEIEQREYIERASAIPELELTAKNAQQMANDNKLVFIFTHTNQEINCYVVHPMDGNTNSNILYTSTVGNQNWYKLKTNFSSLVKNCDSFEIVCTDFPIHKVYPLPNWENRHYSSPFGMRIHPITGEYRMHNGVDIPASMGTEVYAVQDGIVTSLSYVDNSSAGLFVEITHDDGYVTQYMHASEVLVTLGQRVNAGDRIMLVGSTGMSTGPHLHFVYMKDGKYLVPEDYLATIHP